MQIDSAFLTCHLDYSRWASERILEACRVLSEDELDRDLKNSHGGVLSTLVHIFLADRVWLSRLTGQPRFSFSDPEETWTLESLGPAWADVHKRFAEWADGVKDVAQVVEYQRMNKSWQKQPVWQIVLHVVNHASYHRGQVTTMLRQLGQVPVETDLHIYFLTFAPVPT